MSGGEQQWVTVAVALANDPPLILADEPRGELDSENAIALLDLLRTASRERGKTVLLLSPDPHAAQAADATLEMDRRTHCRHRVNRLTVNKRALFRSG